MSEERKIKVLIVDDASSGGGTVLMSEYFENVCRFDV